MKKLTTMMTATALVAAAAGTTFAQDRDSKQIDDDWNTSYFYSTYEDDQDAQEYRGDRWDADNTDNFFYRDYERDRRQAQQRSRYENRPMNQPGRSGRVALDREGAAVIGYDLDADGQSDVFYTVTRYEMEMIRRRAQQQGQQGQQQMQRYPGDEEWASGRTAQRDWQQRDRRMSDRSKQQRQQMDRPQLRRVSGEIVETRPFKIASASEKHLFARVETDNNRKMVLNLGPVSTARTLDLRQGDSIQALVSKGTINNRVVPVAHRVRHQGQTITLEQPRIEDLKRLRGEVISTRTANLRNKQGEGKHMMVRLRTDQGQTRTVCLGDNPQKFDRLSEGDEITVLAAPGSVDGRKVYMAKRVNMDGQTMNVSWNKDRQRQGQSDWDRQQRNQRDWNRR